MLFENSWPRILLSENNFADDLYPFFQTSKQHDFCKNMSAKICSLLIILDAWWRHDINTLSTYVYLGVKRAERLWGTFSLHHGNVPKYSLYGMRENNILMFISIPTFFWQNSRTIYFPVILQIRAFVYHKIEKGYTWINILCIKRCKNDTNIWIIYLYLINENLLISIWRHCGRSRSMPLLMISCSPSSSRQHQPRYCLWDSCQIRKIAGCTWTANAGNVFTAAAGKCPDMHHGMCVRYVPWCMLRSLTRGCLCGRAGKTSPTFPAHAKPAISGKRPM